MTSMTKVAACQLPDIRENTDEALSWIEACAKIAAVHEVSLLCFPECFLQGYLVEDKSAARHHALDLSSPAFTRILDRLRNITPLLVIGLIETERGSLYNTAVVVQSGKLVGRYRKCHLLSGERIFQAGSQYPVFKAGGLIFGINICYDTNFPEAALILKTQGAQLIVCPSNNMMSREKSEQYRLIHNQVRSERSRETGLWLLSSDIRGEQGNRISYGPTALIDPEGTVVSQVPLLEVGILIGEIRDDLGVVT